MGAAKKKKGKKRIISHTHATKTLIFLRLERAKFTFRFYRFSKHGLSKKLGVLIALSKGASGCLTKEALDRNKCRILPKAWVYKLNYKNGNTCPHIPNKECGLET